MRVVKQGSRLCFSQFKQQQPVSKRRCLQTLGARSRPHTCVGEAGAAGVFLERGAAQLSSRRLSSGVYWRARGGGRAGSGFSFLLDPRRRGDSPSKRRPRRARTSGPSADVHMRPHLSSEILIWKANSPSFVRGALSPLARVQSCNEQQLAPRPVLGSCIPHSDECVICCLFSTRFCSASNRPRTHTRPVCVTHLAMAHSSRLQEKKV